MSRTGARVWVMPSARSCRPTMSPTARSRSGSQLEARPIPDGKRRGPGEVGAAQTFHVEDGRDLVPARGHGGGLHPMLEGRHVLEPVGHPRFETGHVPDTVRVALGEVVGVRDVGREVARDLRHLLLERQLVQQDLRALHVGADVGCHSAVLPEAPLAAAASKSCPDGSDSAVGGSRFARRAARSPAGRNVSGGAKVRTRSATGWSRPGPACGRCPLRRGRRRWRWRRQRRDPTARVNPSRRGWCGPERSGRRVDRERPSCAVHARPPPVSCRPGRTTEAWLPTGTSTSRSNWPSWRRQCTAASPCGVRCRAAAEVSAAGGSGRTRIRR